MSHGRNPRPAPRGSATANFIKRHAFRSLLVFHFIGLALTVGIRFASLVIDRVTGTADLEALSWGRDLTGALARTLTLPGFLLTIATGILMVLLRYGRRPPLWVWIKVALTTAALSLATPVVAPALQAAREWARWSVAHGHLAPQFLDSVARVNLYGGIVFALFLLNIPVAVWKPFAGVTLSQLLWRRAPRPQHAGANEADDPLPENSSQNDADRPEAVIPRAWERRR
jgi:hypothetical protein